MASTCRNWWPGAIKIEVLPDQPCAGASVGKLSNARTLVVPTATNRGRGRSASKAMVAGGTVIRSECMGCSESFATSTGLNVPAPTCSVTLACRTPLARSCARSDSVKCKPAVGAATDPRAAASAYTVWYSARSASSSPCSPRTARDFKMYGGSGVQPERSITSSGPPPCGPAMMRTRHASASRATNSMASPDPVPCGVTNGSTAPGP